ncbi:MAG: lysophospholipid acyltransferase family protein [Acidobacteriota bacterium]
MIAGVGYPVLRALGATYRFDVEGIEHLRAAERLGQPIHAFWHGRILPGTIYFRGRGIVVITSENFDGEWIARIITRFGYGTARGSTSRGGGRALRQLVRDIRARPVAFTLDGPRGPARRAQPGAVWLSKVTGNPILPFHLEADRHWSLRSWDRTQIPRPGARIALTFAEPFVVPPDAGDTALMAAVDRLQEALADCERRCEARLQASAEE